MSIIPGPIDEIVKYGPKMVGSTKKVFEIAGKHRKLTAAGVLLADANFNDGGIIGGTLDTLGGAVGNTASSLATGLAGGLKSLTGSALEGEGGGILKAVGIGGGALAAAPLVLNAVGAIGGLFRRKETPKPGEGGNNAATMMQQQMMMMMQQQAMQQQAMQQQAMQQQATSLKIESANTRKPTAPQHSGKPPSAGVMSASREFTKEPTKVEQPKRDSAQKANRTPRPSQKPAEHSVMNLRSKGEESEGDGKKKGRY